MIILITEYESNIVIVNLSVNKESSLKIDSTERVIANSKAGIGIRRLNNFGAFVVDNPIRINLRFSFGIQDDSLIRSEVSREDSRVVGAVVKMIWNRIGIVILFADVTDSIIIGIILIGIIDESAVVNFVKNAIVVDILM